MGENVQYIALVIGSGQGCDYTVACNRTWEELAAKTLDEALDEAEKYLVDAYQVPVEEIEILEVKDRCIVDIDAIEQMRAQKQSEAHKKETEESERAELTRLKEKYEK